MSEAARETFGHDARKGVTWTVARDVEHLGPRIQVNLDDAALIRLVRNRGGQPLVLKLETENGLVTVEIAGERL